MIRVLYLFRKTQSRVTMPLEIPSRLWDFTFGGCASLRTLNSSH